MESTRSEVGVVNPCGAMEAADDTVDGDEFTQAPCKSLEVLYSTRFTLAGYSDERLLLILVLLVRFTWKLGKSWFVRNGPQKRG